MTTPQGNPRARIVVAAGAIAVVAVAGCGSDHNTSAGASVTVSSPTATAAPDFSATQPGPTTQPNRCRDICDADAVTAIGLAEVFSYHGRDSDPAAAAAARAAVYLDPHYVRAVGATWALLAPVTGTQWTQWTAADSTVTADVALTSDNHPPDTAQRAYRQASVTLTPSDVPAFPVWVVLTAGGPHGWQISSITTQ